MKDSISIVVVAKNEMPHIWHTVNNYLLHLQDYDLDYEIIVVDDNSHDEMQTRETFSGAEDRNIKYKDVVFDSIALSKQFGIDEAENDIIYVSDAHVAVPHDFIPQTYAFMRNHPDCAVLYTPLTFEKLEEEYAHYKIHYNTDFWWDGKKSISDKPYQCAAGNQGLFVIRKEDWQGFEAFFNYGSGEVLVALKQWMFGKKAWMYPGVMHMHWQRGRQYKHDFEEIAKNHIVSAYLLGGKDYAKRAWERYQSKLSKEKYKQLLQNWIDRRKYYKKHAKYNLDEIRQYFKDNNIPT